MLDRTLAVIGSTSVGKSALTIRFIEKKFSNEYDPTISKTYKQKFVTNGINYQLTINDTAGLEQHAQIPLQYIKSHGFILVYSIADRQSFEIIRDIYDRLVEDLSEQTVSFVLIGNKSDLDDQRRISYEAGKQLAQKWRDNGYHTSFIETSALTGDKVEEVFVTLLNSIEKQADANNQTTNNANNIHSNIVPKRKPEHQSSSEKKNCNIS